MNTAAHARLAKAAVGQSRLSFASTSSAADEVLVEYLQIIPDSIDSEHYGHNAVLCIP